MVVLGGSKAGTDRTGQMQNYSEVLREIKNTCQHHKQYSVLFHFQLDFKGVDKKNE